MPDLRQPGRRVVVTGMATINPLGDQLETYLEALLAGRSGIGPWRTLDARHLECRVGGDLGDYDTSAAFARLRPRLPASMARGAQRLMRATNFSARLTMLTALDAWCDAGLSGVDVDPWRVSVPVGGHNVNSRYIAGNAARYREDPDTMDALAGIHGLDTNVAGCVAEALQARGPTMTLGGACASGNLALRAGWRDITSGEADIAVVAGAPFDMTEMDVHASATLSAVVVDPALQEDPTRASRPFDVKRAGFVPSHGAATIVLESLDHARARHARIHAELLGVYANGNGSHLPTPSWEMQARLVRALLDATGVPTEQVDYVNCHATSTPLGDGEESRALREVFRAHAARLRVNAPKSMLGHTCWAAPLVETIGGILQMQVGRLHPSINVDTQDPAIGLDVCREGAVDCDAQVMLKNAFGFGGINCSSLFAREAA